VRYIVEGARDVKQAVGLSHIAQALCYNGVQNPGHGVKNPDQPIGPWDGVVSLALLSQDDRG
jgi:hypothetical protein